MKQMVRNVSSTLAAALLVIFAITASARAQATGSIHGHVNNPIGQPVAHGQVKLTTDRASDEKSRKYQYTFDIDAAGDYKGADITPGSYIAIVFADGKSIDFNDSATI